MKTTIAVVSSLFVCQFAFAQETLQTVTARGDVSNGDITVNGRLKIANTNINMIGVSGSDYLDIRGVNDSPILRFNRNSLDAYFMNGNVGIGTFSPDARLSVVGTGNDLVKLRGNSGGNTGVSIQNTGGGNPQIRFLNSGGTEKAAITLINSEETSGRGAIYIYDGVANVMNLKNGNVGIGTTNPQDYKLAVAGNMIAESVKVKLVANWPDYVFSKNHSLRSLGDLEKFIQTNKHLPEVPSADEVKKDGIDLGDMNATLLKKIEELTLYLIEQNKEINNLKKEISIIKQK